ncbi:MAG: hypothetical protein AB2A00_09590 [Myxococcota bacterium]
MKWTKGLLLLALMLVDIGACGGEGEGGAGDGGSETGTGASSTSGGGSGNGTSSGGSAQPQVIQESEPNDANAAGEVTRLPTVSGTVSYVLRGSLPTGGLDSNGIYSGDKDIFEVEVTIPVSLSVRVHWQGNADVDTALVTDRILVSDVTTNKPARFDIELAGGGYYYLSVQSASGAADYEANVFFTALGGSSSGGTSSGGGGGACFDGECSTYLDPGLYYTYNFWPDCSYVKFTEYSLTSSTDREEGWYSLGQGTVTFTPDEGEAYTKEFARSDDGSTVWLSGDAYTCISH